MTAASERGNRLFRFLDIWAGTPLGAVCGITRRRRAGPPPAIKRIGLLRTAAIGDTVLLSGPVADLRQSFPESSITLFCGGSNLEVARLVPGLDDVVRLPIARPWKAMGIVRRAGAFDAWIDFGQWPRYDALISHCARAAFKVGFRTPGQRRHYVFDRCAAHTTDRHEIENFRALTAMLGASGSSLPRLAVPEGELPLSPGSVVFHMFPGGSRAAVKAWPAERWVELGSRVAGDGRRIVLTGSGRDRPGAEAVAAQMPHGAATVAAGELDIAATARLLTGCAAVVSVDTGIMHMASALGCRLVALHGPTSAKRWGPLNPTSTAVQSAYSREPWIQLGFEGPRAGDACMRCITVDQVHDALDRVLSA